MTYNKQKVIDIALAEVGYLEKASNSNLDSKTENAGSANYTKYARDLATYPFYNGRKYGVAWCDVFIDWCFVQAYGKDAALALTCQPAEAEDNCGAGCKYSRDYFKAKGQLYNKPEPGDQIFFYNKDKTTISHTGIVYDVDGSKVYTVEGNTSGSSGVVANGGGVFKKSYSLSYNRIAGYGRPAYNDSFVKAENQPVITPKVENTVANTDKEKTAVNAAQYGKSISIAMNTLRKGNKGKQVKTLQRLLIIETCDVGKNGADGDFGAMTESAVKEFQKKHGLEVDGIVGKNTWTKLLK